MELKTEMFVLGTEARLPNKIIHLEVAPLFQDSFGHMVISYGFLLS